MSHAHPSGCRVASSCTYLESSTSQNRTRGTLVNQRTPVDSLISSIPFAISATLRYYRRYSDERSSVHCSTERNGAMFTRNYG